MLSCTTAPYTGRYEKSQREDGRRVHKWFLTDQFGTEHLAVIGIETDTMDGHYSYQAVSAASQTESMHACILPALGYACACILEPLWTSWRLSY